MKQKTRGSLSCSACRQQWRLDRGSSRDGSDEGGCRLYDQAVNPTRQSEAVPVQNLRVVEPVRMVHEVGQELIHALGRLPGQLGQG